MVTIIIAGLVILALAFIAFAMFHPPDAKTEANENGADRDWTAQATLAEMRNQGDSLPEQPSRAETAAAD